MEYLLSLKHREHWNIIRFELNELDRCFNPVGTIFCTILIAHWIGRKNKARFHQRQFQIYEDQAEPHSESLRFLKLDQQFFPNIQIIMKKNKILFNNEIQSSFIENKQRAIEHNSSAFISNFLNNYFMIPVSGRMLHHEGLN